MDAVEGVVMSMGGVELPIGGVELPMGGVELCYVACSEGCGKTFTAALSGCHDLCPNDFVSPLGS